MQKIDKDQLRKMNDEQKEDFVLINVLPRKFFNEKHIRTSINVPFEDEDFVETVERVAGSKTRNIVVYCANTECDVSPKAAEKLSEEGFENVYDYEGGTKDWHEGKKEEAA